MKYCRNCKTNVYPILKQHEASQQSILSCPLCDSTLLTQYQPRPVWKKHDTCWWWQRKPGMLCKYKQYGTVIEVNAAGDIARIRVVNETIVLRPTARLHYLGPEKTLNR